MYKIAHFFTDYIIHNGMIEESDRNIYEYGFTITIEVGLFALYSLFFVIYLHMFIEGLLFFIIFVPLRSYAGGLHLNKFYACFLLSCLTFSGILLSVKYICIQIPNAFSLTLLLIFETFIYTIYPIENVNRTIDSKENAYFKRKLKKFLLLDLLIDLICIILKNNTCVLLIEITCFLVLMSMILGKYTIKTPQNNINRILYLQNKIYYKVFGNSDKQQKDSSN